MNKYNKLMIFEVVKTYDLETIPPVIPTEEGWSFRIEILKDCSDQGLYSARVCRRESYNLSPTFSQEDSTSDSLNQDYVHEIIVLDTGKDWSEIREKSAEKALEKVLKGIYEIFDL